MKTFAARAVAVTDLKRIGIAGAHRTGKSTLARTLSLNLNSSTGNMLEFVPTHVSDAMIWRSSNISPSDNLTFAERVILQQGILDHMQVVNAGAPDFAIFDRTPIDFVGYLMANIDTTCSNLFTSHVERFIADCLRLTSQSIDKIVILQPAIDVKPDACKTGKTYLSKPYQMAVNNHVIATCVKYISPDRYMIVPEHVMSTDDRLDFILDNL